MPYITREDGEHFVIPSYRDVLITKRKSQLKKDILALSQNYGEYITLHKKGSAQYEVAFSPDTGYLLGESIWHHLKRPLDMVYCEAIPNTTEAILVIVKAGSVYLDGTFPIDSIPEELIVFLTQQNNFDIFIHGDVPISETPEDGKFSFDANSVKSFTILDKPVFPTLPLLKIYQLQLVDPVLKAYGIGVFPTRQLLTTIVVLGLLWMVWSYLTAPSAEIVEQAPVQNPYQGYNQALMTPAPEQEMDAFLQAYKNLLSMPGWQPVEIEYSHGNLLASVQSLGSKIETLFKWAQENNIDTIVRSQGISVSTKLDLKNRKVPTHIYPIKQVIAAISDNLSEIYPGNHLKLADPVSKGPYSEVLITIDLDKESPMLIALIGNALKDLPCSINSIKLKIENGSISGSIIINALGS